MVLKNLLIKFFCNYLVMINKRFDALKIYKYKINGKIFSFIKKPCDSVIKRIEDVSSNNYLILMQKEEVICDVINQIVYDLTNNKLVNKKILENNLINMIMGNIWLRNSNWIKINFNKLKNKYDSDFYDIITFIYYNFFGFS